MPLLVSKPDKERPRKKCRQTEWPSGSTDYSDNPKNHKADEHVDFNADPFGDKEAYITDPKNLVPISDPRPPARTLSSNDESMSKSKSESENQSMKVESQRSGSEISAGHGQIIERSSSEVYKTGDLEASEIKTGETEATDGLIKKREVKDTDAEDRK